MRVDERMKECGRVPESNRMSLSITEPRRPAVQVVTMHARCESLESESNRLRPLTKGVHEPCIEAVRDGVPRAGIEPAHPRISPASSTAELPRRGVEAVGVEPTLRNLQGWEPRPAGAPADR
jgi:hypothetical protein